MAERSAKRSAKQQVREARRDVHRTLLIDAAERVFAERGYEKTRMQDIAAESGLAMATVYGVVASKEELYAEVHRIRGRAMLEAAIKATVGVGSAFEAFLAGISAYTEFLVGHQHYLQLHLHESQPWAVQPRFHSDEQAQLWKEGLSLTTEVLRAAIAEGSVVDENPTVLSRLMIAAHQVFLAEWVAGGMIEAPADLVARMQAHAERAFGAGKRSKKPR